MNPILSRLKPILLNTGLQTKDNSLYQLLSTLINALIAEDNLIASISGTMPGGFTPGSIIFAGGSGQLAQDNANLFWDIANTRLGLRDDSPRYPFVVNGDGAFILANFYSTILSVIILSDNENPLSAGANRVEIGLDPSVGGGYIQASQAGLGGLNFALMPSGGNVGIGLTTLTAYFHIKGGTTSANTAPIKLTSGSLNTIAEDGAIEYNNTHYVTNWKALRYPLGGTLFDHFADVGNSTTTETDLYSDTTIANTLANNGDKLRAEYGGIIVGHATATREIKVWFAGTAIFDSTAIVVSANASWTLDVLLIRVSSSVVRYKIFLDLQNAPLADYTSVGELTGLTLSNTNILKITGQAGGVGAATNDIVAKLGTVEFKAAA